MVTALLSGVKPASDFSFDRTQGRDCQLTLRRARMKADRRGVSVKSSRKCLRMRACVRACVRAVVRACVRDT